MSNAPKMDEKDKRLIELAIQLEQTKEHLRQQRRNLEATAMLQEAGTHQVMQELMARAEKAEAEAKHWKANHDNQVALNAILRQREDLPVDRIPAMRKMQALQAKLDAVMLEYCAGEMTPEQRAVWAQNQRPVRDGKLREAALVGGSVPYPKVNVRLETPCGTGSAAQYVSPERVEVEDDGSLTAVIRTFRGSDGMIELMP